MGEPRYFKRPARSACPGHETPEGARYCNGSCQRVPPPPLVSRDHLKRMPALITARYALEHGQGLLAIERTAVLAELDELDRRRAAETPESTAAAAARLQRLESFAGDVRSAADVIAREAAVLLSQAIELNPSPAELDRDAQRRRFTEAGTSLPCDACGAGRCEPCALTCPTLVKG